VIPKKKRGGQRDKKMETGHRKQETVIRRRITNAHIIVSRRELKMPHKDRNCNDKAT
jgi:hypothetical protein